jgi:hypothetical protein
MGSRVEKEGSENKAHGKMANIFAQPYIGRPTTIRWSFHRKRRFYWYSRALSMSSSVASKATGRLVKKNRRRKSMLVA